MSPSEKSFYYDAARVTQATETMLGLSAVQAVLVQENKDRLINPQMLSQDREHITSFLSNPNSDKPMADKIGTVRSLYGVDHVKKITQLGDNAKVADAKNLASDGRFHFTDNPHEYYVGQQERVDPNKMLNILAQESPETFQKFMQSAGTLEVICNKLSPTAKERFIEMTQQQSGPLGPCIKEAIGFFSSAPEQLRQMHQDPATPAWQKQALNSSVLGTAPTIKPSSMKV